jgi:protein-S-isoprenylcysteine O-methyltransferase Ste14
VNAAHGSCEDPANNMLARVFNRRFAGNYLSTLGFIALAYWLIADVSNFHRGALQGSGSSACSQRRGADRAHTDARAHRAVRHRAGSLLRRVSVVALQGVRVPAGPVVHRCCGCGARSRARTPPGARASRGRCRCAFAPSPAARLAALALLLKFFFAPLMINWCLNHLADMAGAVVQLIDGVRQGQHGRALFDASLFWALFQCILFADTLLFTLGYIVEVPALRNRIRSVDPTFFGWFVCLACYPPFNDFTGRFLQWQSSDFPYFENTAFHVTANVVLLIAMTLYSWASIALGFKASNLTNRGIVSRGPYAVVRHPAYAAKNFAWWIGSLPAFSVWFASGDLQAAFYSVFAMAGWTTIYVLRAITEERHLLMGRNGYAEYAQRVRWRFVPASSEGGNNEVEMSFRAWLISCALVGTFVSAQAAPQKATFATDVATVQWPLGGTGSGSAPRTGRTSNSWWSNSAPRAASASNSAWWVIPRPSPSASIRWRTCGVRASDPAALLSPGPRGCRRARLHGQPAAQQLLDQHRGGRPRPGRARARHQPDDALPRPTPPRSKSASSACRRRTAGDAVLDGGHAGDRPSTASTSTPTGPARRATSRTWCATGAPSNACSRRATASSACRYGGFAAGKAQGQRFLPRRKDRRTLVVRRPRGLPASGRRA